MDSVVKEGPLRPFLYHGEIFLGLFEELVYAHQQVVVEGRVLHLFSNVFGDVFSVVFVEIPQVEEQHQPVVSMMSDHSANGLVGLSYSLYLVPLVCIQHLSGRDVLLFLLQEVHFALNLNVCVFGEGNAENDDTPRHGVDEVDSFAEFGSAHCEVNGPLLVFSNKLLNLNLLLLGVVLLNEDLLVGSERSHYLVLSPNVDEVVHLNVAGEKEEHSLGDYLSEFLHLLSHQHDLKLIVLVLVVQIYGSLLYCFDYLAIELFLPIDHVGPFVLDWKPQPDFPFEGGQGTQCARSHDYATRMLAFDFVERVRGVHAPKGESDFTLYLFDMSYEAVARSLGRYVLLGINPNFANEIQQLNEGLKHRALIRGQVILSDEVL